MRRLLCVLALAACGSDIDREDGAFCKSSRNCRSNLCVEKECSSGQLGSPCTVQSQCRVAARCDAVTKKCAPLAGLGEACKVAGDCTSSLCLDHVCRDRAHLDAEKRKRDAAREAEMLEKAGVPNQGSAVEQMIHPPGPGTRVRTVTITSKETALAACKPDERLIGGGCNASTVLASYPSGHSEQDTVGGRWNCRGHRSADVTAYALCTKLDPK